MMDVEFSRTSEGGAVPCIRGDGQNVGPRVPVRHWMLAVPEGLCAHDASARKQVAELRRAFVAEVLGLVEARSGPALRLDAHCVAPGSLQGGAVSLVHRVRPPVELGVHVHALVLDGAYLGGARDSPPTFVPMLEGPEPALLRALARRVRARLLARWARHRDDDGVRVLDRLVVAQVSVSGPEATSTVLRSRRAGERVVHRLAHPFTDGTTHVEFSTDDLVQRLVSLVPAPHGRRVSFHGALVPHTLAKWRARPLQLLLLPAAAPRRASVASSARC